jgi:hypothetical protein
MRGLTRWAVIGILIISCGNNAVGPESRPPDCGPPGSQLTMFPDSLRLVVGSADNAYLDWGCPGPPANVAVGWTIRDQTIAAFGPANPGAPSPYDPQLIHSLAPGQTFVVVETAGLLDSVLVVVPDTVVMESIAYVAAGGEASCAITDGGTTLCWGAGTGSVLGEPWVDPAIGTCWGSPCSPMPVPRETDLSSVQPMTTHACGLDPFGRASCWGDNYALQLGVPNRGAVYDAVAVGGGKTFTTLTLGRQYTCGLTSDGDAYCWGDNHAGKLGGNQRNGPIGTPELVSGGLKWVSLDAQAETTCGVTDAGHLYCWGSFGTSVRTVAGAETCQVGADKSGPVNEQCAYVPLRMSLDSGTGPDPIFVQTSGSCVLTSEGGVYCLDDARTRYASVDGLGPIASISGGDNHTCGLSAGGAAWCWGSNGDGRLGDGTAEGRSEPVAVTGGHTFTQLAVGSAHTCGLTDVREVWCWGTNHLGQAGTSILSEAWAPVKVHGQD